MNRRDFLLSSLQVGGLTAIYSLGAFKEAKALGLLQTLLGTSQESAASWASWTRTSQALDVDLCIFFDDTSAGANEIGFSSGDVLMGANLVATQQGNVAGAVGGYRQLDANGDGFDITQAATTAVVVNKDAWTVAVWIKDFVQTALGNDHWLDFQAGTNELNLGSNATSNKLRGYLLAGSVIKFNNVLTTDDITAASDIWLVACSDGAETLIGFTVGETQPTKLSDFAANKRMLAGAASKFDGAFTSYNYLFHYTAATNTPDAKVKAFVMDSSCLIDLGS